MNKINKDGFTLIELLIYTVIFSVVAGLMTGILTTTIKINQRESSSNEVTSQLNFVMQTIQRLTKESSIIIVNSTSTDYDVDAQVGLPQSRLVLRMKDSGGAPTTDRDPITIYTSSSTIKMSQGSGANQIISDLTSNRVVVDQLQFTKHTQYPGHDTVSIDIQLSYNTQNPQAKATRNLTTAIARVSAATFDSNLLPGVDNQYEIGYSTNQRWKNISISNLLNLGQLSVDPVGAQNGSIYYNTTLNSFKGYASSTWSTISSLWNSSSTSIYYNTGNVGIGTAAPIAGKLVVNGTIDVSNNKITSVATPIASTDAATKGYVDAAGVSDTIYSLTANNGMYNNRIADMTPPAAYTEVCFKSGSTQYDYHSTSASTSGGNCVPGDVGYIIEADERSVNYWEMAKQTCLNYGMRLPEPFEWKLACKNAATWSLINMTGNWEWASNFSLPMFLGNDSGVESAIFGGSGCNYAGWNWVGYGTGYEHSNAFRCVR